MNADSKWYIEKHFLRQNRFTNAQITCKRVGLITPVYPNFTAGLIKP